MNRKMKMATIAFLAFLMFVGIVYAITYYSYRQTLTVPGIRVYEQGTTTEIPTDSDITDFWTWDGTNFAVTFDIYNVDSTALTTSVTTPIILGWTFVVSGTGSLVVGGTQTVTITATPPNINPGTTSGEFSITVDAV